MNHWPDLDETCQGGSQHSLEASYEKKFQLAGLAGACGRAKKIEI